MDDNYGGERDSSDGRYDLSRRTLLRTGGAASAALLGLGTASAGGAGGAGDSCDVDELVEEMTLDEKVSRTHGADGGPEGIAGYLQGVERLDVPGMGMADGPPGASLGEPTTDFPHPIATAATFDPSLAAEQGAAIAREVKSGGVSVLLAPSMDTFRVPLHSRSGETYGEDPQLGSEMAAAYVGAVQSEDVIATLKHFVAYNQTRTTGDVADYYSTSEHNVVVGERALREIYMPPFRASVTEGDAGAVMPAYNKINGEYCSQNEWLLREVLKGEWDFDGFVVSDWGGTHSTIDAARSGLDIEMPSANFFGETLAEAVRNGELDESIVDEMVRRGLRSQCEIGALDGERDGDESERGTDEHFALAERIAEEGIVLLKNDCEFLPLDDDVDEIALVGPTPTEFKPSVGVSVGGSDHVTAIRRVGPVDGIEAVAGDDVSVTTVSSRRYELLEADDGFDFEYRDADGGTLDSGTASTIDVDGYGVGDDAEVATASWEGTVTPDDEGAYGVALTSTGESTLYVDGESVVENLGGGFAGPDTERGSVELEAGESYDVRVEVRGAAPVRLEWSSPAAIRDAADAAADADVALVLARTDTNYGDDRKQYALPGTQNELIDAVACANDDTAVVLNTEAPVATPWFDDVPAALQTWFPGQEGGHALANVLFGEANPSGKTPVTWAEELEDYLPGEIETLLEDGRAYPGVDGEVHYDEGVFVGYRHFDADDVDPVVPFGHGESYTEFEYSDLELTPTIDHPDEASIRATLCVENVGDRAGAEAVQLYVADPEASVPRPPKELAAIEKVRLEPGESATVELELGADAFAFYDPEEDAWTVELGEFEVLVGSSSRDVRLAETIGWPGSSKSAGKGDDRSKGADEGCGRSKGRGD